MEKKRTNLVLFFFNLVLFKKNAKYLALNDQSLGGEVTNKVNMEISILLLLLHSMNTLSTMGKKKNIPVMFG